MNWFVDVKPENDESHAKTRYEQQSKFEKITGLNKKDTVNNNNVRAYMFKMG